MRRSRIVLLINVLILVTVVGAVSVLGLVLLTGASSATAFSIGSPTSAASAGSTVITVPITIGDKGYFGFSDMQVNVALKDSAGTQLISGTFGPYSVSPGQTITEDATLALNTASLSSSELQGLATSAQNLTVAASLSGSMPPFLGVSGNVNAQIQWGAPVSGLKVGAPVFSQYNSTTFEAAVPVTFSNDNQYYTISGTGSASVLNSTGQQVGSGSVTLNVPPGSQFNQAVDLFVKIPQSQLQSLLTTDQTLSYSAVFSLPTGGSSFSITEPVSYSWGAPLKGLTVGALSGGVYNATDSSVSAPFSFTDNSSFLALSGTLSGSITDSSGNVVGTVSPLSISATPGQHFSSTINGYILNTAVGASSYVLHLTFSSSYGAVTMEMTVNG